MTQKVTILERTDNKRWPRQETLDLGTRLMTLTQAFYEWPLVLLLLEEFSAEIVEEVVGHANFKATVVDLVDEAFVPLSFDATGCHNLMMRYLANLI